MDTDYHGRFGLKSKFVIKKNKSRSFLDRMNRRRATEKTFQEKGGGTLYREDAKSAKKIQGLGVKNITPFATFAALRFDYYYLFLDRMNSLKATGRRKARGIK